MDIILRGSIQWNQREFRRRAQGMRCLCFGNIPEGQAFGEPDYKVMHTGHSHRKESFSDLQIIRYFEELQQ